MIGMHTVHARRRSQRRFAATERGGAAIELALVMPLLILLLFGGYDFGRIMYYAITVSGAAHAGAQWGAQSPATASDTATMRTVAQNHASPFSITATAIRECRCGTTVIGCSDPCGTPPIKIYASVTATRTFTTVVNWPGIPSSVTLTRTAKIRAQ